MGPHRLHSRTSERREPQCPHRPRVTDGLLGEDAGAQVEDPPDGGAGLGAVRQVEPDRSEQEMGFGAIAVVDTAGDRPATLAGVAGQRGTADTDPAVGQDHERLAGPFEVGNEVVEHDAPQWIDVARPESVEWSVQLSGRRPGDA